MRAARRAAAVVLVSLLAAARPAPAQTESSSGAPVLASSRSDATGASAAPADSAGRSVVRPAAADRQSAPAGASEPWFIEGESLHGTSQSGTELRVPHITHGVLDIRARAGHMSPDREILSLRDSVVIADTARTLMSNEGIYRRTPRLLDMAGDVRGEGPEGDFRCTDLTWDRLSGRLILRGEPVLTELDRVLESARIEYDTESRRGLALGRVRILLLPDSVRAFGERCDYDDRSGRSVLTGEPRLVVPGGADAPEMVVRADTLVLHELDRSGEAIGSVHIVRGDLRTRSRRAQFRLEQNRIDLTGEPVAWDLDGDIRADTMSVRVRERKADQLRAWGSVRVRYEPRDKAGERNLIFGDTLTAGLSGGALTGMKVYGRAQSLYLPAIRDVLTGSGRNLSQAREIHVFLREGQAQWVDLIGKASGTYLYPSDATRRRLREPAILDSIVPAWVREPAPARDPGAEPPPLSEFLQAFVRERSLAFPDSGGSFDQLFNERVEYEADTIRFFVPEDRIRLQGNGGLRYRESTLKSGRIDYDAERRLVLAFEKPELSDGQSTVTGVKMTYRTDEQEGIVYRGRTEFDGAWYWGREVKKLPGNELLVKRGDYTTCDLDSAPHYHFSSGRMKLIQKDKAVARPVVLYIKRIPVLALPYYIFPLRKGRHSGITMPEMEVGFNRNAGRFVRNLGYYLALSDYMDARAWFDYYERGPRYYLNGEYRYRVRYLLDGNVDASWLRETNDYGGRSRGWSLQSAHSQTLGKNATAKVSTNFTTSQTFRGDQNFGAGIDERLNRKLKSSLELRKGWSRTSFSAGATRTEYLDETTGSGVKMQVDGPYADFTLNTGALGRAPDASGRSGHWAALSSVSYGTNFRYRTTYERRFNGKRTTGRAFQQNVSLSDNRRLGPFLRLSPSLNASWALFGRDNQGRGNQVGASWSFGTSASNTLYGTYLFPAGPLAGLRHIVEPSVSWGFSPELKSLTYADPADSTGQRRLARFPSVGGISLSGTKRSALSLSVSQRVHAKWKLGSRVVKQENLLTFTTSSSYDFLAKSVPGQRTRRFSSISNSLRFRPWSSFETSASVSHDPYRRVPLSFSIRTDATITAATFAGSRDSVGTSEQTYGEFGSVANQGPASSQRRFPASPATSNLTWSSQIIHSYSTTRGVSTPTKSLTLNLTISFRPTAKWRCDGSVYADVREREVISHSFSLNRDLHCWELRFNHRTVGGRSEYFFHVGIRQLPEVKYERESR